MNAENQASPATASAESEIVVIEVQTRVALVAGRFAPVIAPVLERECFSFSRRGPLGYSVRRRRVEHYAFDGGQFVFPAALVPRVRQHLERRGYGVALKDDVWWGHLRSADLRLLDDSELTVLEREYLAALAASPRGQIVLRRTADVARAVALMGRLFAKHSLFVVARDQRGVRSLVEQIAASSDRPVTSDSRLTWSHHPRMFVGTEKLFECASSSGFHIAVLADVESALAKITDMLTRDWRHGTWYAVLLRSDYERLRESEWFRLEAIFGPVIFPPGGGSQVPEISVAFLDGMQRPAGRREARGLERKRSQYWHDQTWNSMVAQLAKETASGRAPDGLAADLLPRRRPWVTVLVESTEHAQELQKRLPGWQLLTANSATSCLPEVGHRKIVTMTYAADVGIIGDVVIRADGGPDWPLGDALLTTQAAEPSERCLVIDFADCRDPRAASDTASRRAAYEQLNWQIAGFDEGVGNRLIEQPQRRRNRVR